MTFERALRELLAGIERGLRELQWAWSRHPWFRLDRRTRDRLFTQFIICLLAGSLVLGLAPGFLHLP